MKSSIELLGRANVTIAILLQRLIWNLATPEIRRRVKVETEMKRPSHSGTICSDAQAGCVGLTSAPPMLHDVASGKGVAVSFMISVLSGERLNDRVGDRASILVEHEVATAHR